MNENILEKFDTIILNQENTNNLTKEILTDITTKFDDIKTELQYNTTQTQSLDDDIKEVQSHLDTKVDKVDGKSLSTNDYTDEEKSKLANLEISPEMHRVTFRGKNLGTSVTEAQKAAIQDGSFDDLFLGDYWVINGVNWRIVDIDYWYNTGSTALTTHHLVIMPDTSLYTAIMNSDFTTAGGYVGSEMYTTNLAQAKTTITSAFGDMVLTHKEYLSKAATDGVVTGMALKDSSVELPSEIMMYGTNIFSPINDGTCTFDGNTFCKTQLALFAVAPKFITIRSWYWLRDVVSSNSFAGVGSNGFAYWNFVYGDYGVRPVFSIG